MTACTFIFELKSYKIFVVYALNLTLYSCVEYFKPFDLKQKTCKPLLQKVYMGKQISVKMDDMNAPHFLSSIL
jgi:hypothetical protein